jgi:hypothetical protein
VSADDGQVRGGQERPGAGDPVGSAVPQPVAVGRELARGLSIVELAQDRPGPVVNRCCGRPWMLTADKGRSDNREGLGVGCDELRGRRA